MILTEKDRRGLEWLADRCGRLASEAKVARKYSPAGSFSEEEMELLTAILDARDAARRLRKVLWPN